MKSSPPLKTTTMDPRKPALMLVLSMVAGWSFAQAPAKPEPLPQPPPPPPDVLGEADVEPQVTIVQNGDQTTEEVRVQGQLRYIRVTPRHGRSYFLIPDAANTTFIRRDGIDPTVRVPMWVLFSF
jgi:hypothetical protein